MKRPSEPVRWNQKRQRRREAIDDAIERGLIPEVVSDLRIADAMLRSELHGGETQLRETVHRLEGLIDGISGIGLGPYGQTQLEAYQTALQVVKAVRYTSPREEQRQWVAERMRKPRCLPSL